MMSMDNHTCPAADDDLLVVFDLALLSTLFGLFKNQCNVALAILVQVRKFILGKQITCCRCCQSW